MAVGATLGTTLVTTLGCFVGLAVGSTLGKIDEIAVGVNEGLVGVMDGVTVGLTLGEKVQAPPVDPKKMFVGEVMTVPNQ